MREWGLIWRPSPRGGRFSLTRRPTDPQKGRQPPKCGIHKPTVNYTPLPPANKAAHCDSERPRQTVRAIGSRKWVIEAPGGSQSAPQGLNPPSAWRCPLKSSVGVPLLQRRLPPRPTACAHPCRRVAPLYRLDNVPISIHSVAL
ncbi:hypothetical protein TcG_06937 [Trypanosoma cruzi]|nr:hypothetical protein TcG_06937 [Trypanosoma cruzi]